MSLPSLDQSPRDPSFVQNPYPFYAKARALGPLVHWQDYGMPMATDFTKVNAILRDRRFGREAPPGFAPEIPEHLEPFYRLDQSAMLQREPPAHTRLRSLVLAASTSSQHSLKNCLSSSSPDCSASQTAWPPNFWAGPTRW